MLLAIPYLSSYVFYCCIYLFYSAMPNSRPRVVRPVGSMKTNKYVQLTYALREGQIKSSEEPAKHTNITNTAEHCVDYCSRPPARRKRLIGPHPPVDCADPRISSLFFFFFFSEKNYMNRSMRACKHFF